MCLLKKGRGIRTLIQYSGRLNRNPECKNEYFRKRPVPLGVQSLLQDKRSAVPRPGVPRPTAPAPAGPSDPPGAPLRIVLLPIPRHMDSQTLAPAPGPPRDGCSNTLWVLTPHVPKILASSPPAPASPHRMGAAAGQGLRGRRPSLQPLRFSGEGACRHHQSARGPKDPAPHQDRRRPFGRGGILSELISPSPLPCSGRSLCLRRLRMPAAGRRRTD